MILSSLQHWLLYLFIYALFYYLFIEFLMCIFVHDVFNCLTINRFVVCCAYIDNKGVEKAVQLSLLSDVFYNQTALQKR